MRTGWIKILIPALIVVLFFSLTIIPDSHAQNLGPVITSPVSGEAVQGLTRITGSIPSNDFSTYQLAFRFAAAAEENDWFPIVRSEELPNNEVLGEWDTSALTDGNYDLRLRVFRQDGSSQEYLVVDIRVRNYTAIETATAAAQETITPVGTQSGDETMPTAELITPATDGSVEPEINPIEVSQARLENMVLFGGIIGLLFTVLIIGLVLTKERNP